MKGRPLDCRRGCGKGLKLCIAARCGSGGWRSRWCPSVLAMNRPHYQVGHDISLGHAVGWETSISMVERGVGRSNWGRESVVMREDEGW